MFFKSQIFIPIFKLNDTVVCAQCTRNLICKVRSMNQTGFVNSRTAINLRITFNQLEMACSKIHVEITISFVIRLVSVDSMNDFYSVEYTEQSYLHFNQPMAIARHVFLVFVV